MNSFEKSVIGIAKADQALNKVQMIIGGVIFLGFATFIGIFAYKAHKATKKAEEDKLKGLNGAGGNPSSSSDRAEALKNLQKSISLDDVGGLTKSQAEERLNKAYASIVKQMTDEDVKAFNAVIKACGAQNEKCTDSTTEKDKTLKSLGYTSAKFDKLSSLIQKEIQDKLTATK